MDRFLELLTHFHRWCCTDAAFPDTPVTWLATHGLAPPDTLDAWLALGRTPVGTWGLATLPAGWDPAWRILSRQERTLTVEALAYLEHHAPGTVAAALPQPAAPREATQDAPALTGIRDDWSLEAMIACVAQEVARRERVCADAVQVARMTRDEAAQAIGPMRAVVRYLSAHRDAEALPPPPASDTDRTAKATPRQEPLL